MNDVYSYNLPKKDFALLKDKIVALVRNKKPLNIGLFLSKYVDFSEEKKAEIKRQIEILSNNKLVIPYFAVPTDDYKNYLNRFSRVLENLSLMGYSVVTFNMKLTWRLIVNFGGESVYETSIALQRNYSVPVIPGSAIKGITNSLAFLEKNNGKITDNEFKDIFGNQKQEGKVIFFDAMPLINTNDDFIVLDIMNPHYGDYYKNKNGKISPGDWMDPTPIFFLTVEKLNYKFFLASKEKKLTNRSSQILKEALRKNGIGAKTSAGYGYFE